MIAPRLVQWVLALLPSSPFWTASWGVEHPLRSQTAFSDSPKSVVIIGAGSAGLASLQAILQLPEEIRAGWNVVAYEQRNGIGGVWLADPNEPPKPPALPETPLYPALHTNTPVPVMTFPNSPFPPGTPMYPSYHHIQRYHEEYARKEGLIPYIRLEHEVVSAVWTGTSSEGSWNITIRHHDTLQFQHADHLIVGNGHNHYPHYPHLEGIQDWLATNKFREVSHSIYYRRPNQYSNRTILVIGGGASGRDIARQAAPFSTRTYQSLRPGNIDNGTAGGDVIPVPAVVALNRTSVLLADGSALHDIQSIVFATGYDLRIPFLSAPHSDALREIPAEARSPNSESASQLTTNTRYLFPLHEHIFSLSPELPTTALAFIGLPIGVANCFSDSSQALYTAHAISDPSILPSRDELIQDLLKEERRLATLGHDVYNRGHRLTAWPTHSVDYQNRLVEVLRAKGKLPAGPPFTEPWRANSWHRPRLGILVRAWERVKAQGEEAIQRWVGEARTEEDWAAVMDALIEWQEEYERVHGGGSVLGQTMDGVDEWWEY